MSQSRKPALAFKNYTFQYENAAAPTLEGCDFTLYYGELVVLAGFSGVGKSTLLSSANGIIPNFTPGMQRGDILADGESILGKKIADIALKVGSVLQNAENQIVHANVEDEIAFACENLGLSGEEIAKRVEHGCALMGLLPAMETAVLSAGQKQRLITAATLAMGQRILLLDEPFANMDQQGAHALLKTLRALAESGYAVLLAEHRLDMVTPYADRTVWMENGRLRELAPNERPDRGLFAYKSAARKESNEVVAQLSDAGYSVQKKEILREIDLSVQSGQRIVVLGENGCGKTTLLRTLARLIRPTTGSYTQSILPHTGKNPKPEWFKRVGFVYQNPNYQLFMPTVEAEVLYQARDLEWAGEMLTRFKLDKLKEQHPHSLSEGQKRRLSIAAVMAAKPKLLLLDEPTVGQDYGGLAMILENLELLHQKTGGAQVVVTHDSRCAKAMADTVVWMKRGSVYRVGPPELCDAYFSSLSAEVET